MSDNIIDLKSEEAIWAEADAVAQEVKADLVQASDSLDVRPSDITPTRLKQIEVEYLGGEHYNLDRLTQECQAYLTAGTLAYLELGRRLVVVKEVLGHGNFSKWLETYSGLSLTHRTARRYMAVARAVQQRPELRKIAGFGISKANMILALPDACLEEIAEDGTLSGKPVEDYEFKSRAELVRQIERLKASRTKLEAAKEAVEKQRDEYRQNALFFKERVAEYSTGGGLKENEERALATLEQHRKTFEQQCRKVENLSVNGCREEVLAHLMAHTSWMYYRVRRHELVMRERFAGAMEEPMPTGGEWQEVDQLKSQFEGFLAEDPLDGDL